MSNEKQTGRQGEGETIDWESLSSDSSNHRGLHLFPPKHRSYMVIQNKSRHGSCGGRVLTSFILHTDGIETVCAHMKCTRLHNIVELQYIVK